jgi:hypothetical protein
MKVNSLDKGIIEGKQSRKRKTAGTVLPSEVRLVNVRVGNLPIALLVCKCLDECLAVGCQDSNVGISADVGEIGVVAEVRGDALRGTAAAAAGEVQVSGRDCADAGDGRGEDAWQEGDGEEEGGEEPEVGEERVSHRD